MKRSLDSKKLYKNPYLLAIGVLIFLILLQTNFSFAQTKEELESKINTKNTDIEKIEAEIKAFQNELNSLGKEKNSLAKTIKELDLNRKKLLLNISLTENKIEKANLKIQTLGDEIDTKEDSIERDTKAIKYNIKSINELEEKNLISLLIKGNLTNAWNDLDNMLTVKENIRTHILKLKEIKGELETTQNTEEKAKAELIYLKNELADEKKIVDQNKKDKERLLAQTKNNEANYQKLLKEKQALKLALEKELRDYESQLKFILDPNSLPGANVLSWPLENVFVTQLFGKTSSSARLYTSGSHSGVDFRASVGTPVLAMADGIVAGVGDTDTTCPGASFGKWIFIEYNNGLSSAYGHLSLSKVSVGQKVSRGEVVGYSGNTGHTTGPHLHVTIYAKVAAKVQTLPSKSCVGKTLTQPIAPVNAYLDPMIYLPVYNKN